MKNIFSLVRLFFKDTASHFPFPRTCSSQKWQSKNVRGFERVRMLTLVFSMLVALILAHPASAQPRLFVDLDPLTPGIQTDRKRPRRSSGWLLKADSCTDRHGLGRRNSIRRVKA